MVHYRPHLDWNAKLEIFAHLSIAWVVPGGVQHGSRGPWLPL